MVLAPEPRLGLRVPTEDYSMDLAHCRDAHYSPGDLALQVLPLTRPYGVEGIYIGRAVHCTHTPARSSNASSMLSWPQAGLGATVMAVTC